MSANYASVKLSSGFVDAARREADVVRRSLGAQVEYWARLGRAIENAPGFNIAQVRQALEGQAKLETLSAAEQDVVLDQLGADFDAPSTKVREHFAALGAQVGAVGEDAKGRRSPRAPSGRARRGA